MPSAGPHVQCPPALATKYTTGDDAEEGQFTYQLHPESPQPLRGHCRAGTGTGSCARRSHGGVS